MLNQKFFSISVIIIAVVCMAYSGTGKNLVAGKYYATDTVGVLPVLVADTISKNTDSPVTLKQALPFPVSSATVFELNKNVRKYVADYVKQNGHFLEKIKVKSGSSFRVIDEVFTKHDLPVELKYLAVIESNLNSNATSKAGASGLWQLMPVAAKQFGLKMNGKYDERKDVYKSTVAAAKCLNYLHNIFDDWLLTIAAYNSGPGRVLSAIRKSGSRDFWVLQQYLPEETRKHVRKFIAIHYYFDGSGSLTTLTKKETEKYKLSLEGLADTLVTVR